MALRPISVRYWLALLLAICVVPIWIGALYLLDRAAQARQELAEAHLLHTARILSLALDDKLMSVRSALVSLSSSPALDHGDFQTFHRQIIRLAENFKNSSVILSDRDARELVNSRTEFGELLPQRTIKAEIDKVFVTAKPALVPYYTGARTGRSQVSVDVPVIRGGTVIYDLGVTLSCEEFSAILVRANLPPQWIAAFIDEGGTIIGRNVNADKFVGKKAKTPVAPGEKVTQSPTIEGVSTYVAVVGSRETGWGVAVGVPRAVIDAEVTSWRNWMLAGITGLTLFCTAIAWVLGHRIAGAIEGLVAPAIRLGQGLEVTVSPSLVLEAQAVSDALTDACRMLESHRQELQNRDEREKLILRQSEGGLCL